ncbi:MAG TPA: PIG-L deacetylase family protein [Dehalococcoidia bacterium]|nr:PIG-L deacetylase family protein [Dehalococcoidia bacterium]
MPVTKSRPAARRKKKDPIHEKWASEYARALIVTAHPDDAEFLCGGTIALLCDLGLEVTLCVATSGDKGTRDVTIRQQELAAWREAETRAACRVLGVKHTIFWGMPDGFLEEGHELRGMVVRLIRTLKPDLMISWDGFRAGFNHTDHRVIGRAVRDALYPAAHDPHYYAELAAQGIGPHRTAELLMAGAQDPDYHVDVEPFLERKAEAIACHASQVDNRTKDEILNTWLQAGKRNRERRKQTGFDHAESFRRIEFRRPTGAPGTPPAKRAR